MIDTTNKTYQEILAIKRGYSFYARAIISKAFEDLDIKISTIKKANEHLDLFSFFESKDYLKNLCNVSRLDYDLIYQLYIEKVESKDYLYLKPEVSEALAVRLSK